MPRKTVIQGRANDRMAERVAFAPFLKEAQPQRAVQRIEEDRNVHRRFQCRRSGAELAQGDLSSADGSGQPQHPAQGLIHERQLASR